jgi:hypothetical protein
VTVVGLARAMVDTKALSYPGYAELASVWFSCSLVYFLTSFFLSHCYWKYDREWPLLCPLWTSYLRKKKFQCQYKDLTQRVYSPSENGCYGRVVWGNTSYCVKILYIAGHLPFLASHAKWQSCSPRPQSLRQPEKSPSHPKMVPNAPEMK